MKKIYAEIGFGNKSFFSTEIEEGETEQRIPKFILPKHIHDFYLRIWILKTAIILSTKDKVKVKKKEYYNFKFLIGIGGTEK